MSLEKEITYTTKIQEADLINPLVQFSGIMKYWRAIAFLTIPTSLLGFVPGNFFSTPCFCLGGFGLMCVIWRYFQLKRHIQKLLKTPNFEGEHNCVIADAGYSLKSTHFEFKANWGQFSQWSDTEDAICLFVSPLQFNIIPRRCLSDAQYNELREFFDSKIEMRKKTSYDKFTVPVALIVVSMEAGLSVLSIIMTKFGTIK